MECEIKMQTTTMANESNDGSSTLDSRAAEVSSLASVFLFFSRCIEEEVDAEFIGLIRDDLRGPLELAGLKFDDEFYKASTENLVEVLAEEYAALFVVPGCINPYASVFETGCMFKQAADNAIAAYHDAGWDYRRRMSGEFPDHIGTMLGFYGILADAEVQSLVAGDISRADEYKVQRDSFLIEHMGSWGPGWCRRASEAALHPFYKGLLQMTEQVLWGELEQVLDRRHLRELAELNQREAKRLDYDADFRKASGI